MTQGPSRSSALPVALALGTVYVVWGSTYLAIAYVVETLPPLLSAAVRFLTAGGLLVAFLVAQDRWRRRRDPAAPRLPRPSLVEWRTALVVGGLLLLGGNGLVMLSEKTVPSGIAAVMIAATPIWMSVFDSLLTRRAPSRLAIGGLGVGLVGVAILLLPTSGVGALDPFGIGLLVIAEVSWAAGSLYARRGPLPANALLGTGMEQLAGGILLVAAGLLIGEVGRTDLAAVSVQSLMGLAYLIVFGSLVAFTAYTWLLNHAPITTVATYAYVNPVIALALGIFIRGESLTPRSMVAIALIIGAVVAMVSGRPREAEEAVGAPEAAARRADAA